MTKSKTKNIVGLALFLLVALSIPVATSLVKQRQEIRKEAAVSTGVGTLRFDPATITKYPDEIFEVAIKFKTGETEATAATIQNLTLKITYPYTGTTPELDLVGADGNPATQITPNPGLMASGDWSVPVKSVARAGNLVTVEIAALNTSFTGYKSATEATLATLRFKVNRATTTPVTLTVDQTESRMTTKTTPYLDVLQPPVNPVYTLTGAAAPTPTPTTGTAPTPTPTTGTANTITVCPTGTAGQNGCDFIGGEGIQAAVDTAPIGAANQQTTILIKSGTYARQNYTEFLLYLANKRRKAFVHTKGKNLILKGEQGTILDGGASVHALTGIYADGGNVAIENLTITGMKTDSPSCLEGSGLCGNGYGIILAKTAQATIANNLITNLISGILFMDNSQGIVVNNIISNNGDNNTSTNHYGIGFFDSSQGSIINNFITNNEIGIATEKNAQVKVTNNVVNNNKNQGVRQFNNSQINITNTIIANNQEGINAAVTQNIKLRYSLLFHNGTYDADTVVFNSGIIGGLQTNLKGDPKFISATDFHLQAGSPALNTGDPTVCDIDNTRSDMGAYGGGGSTGADCGSGPTPTPTPTTNPTAVNLTFKIKFQGITSKKADQRIKLRVFKPGNNKNFDNIVVTADDTGIYSGQVALAEVTAGSGYTVFVKGPRHLARKFCANNQEGRCTGQGEITLTTGQNTLDLSKLILEAGDTPDPTSATGQQDGRAAMDDYSRIVARFDRIDAASLAVADLNLDGSVNSIDRGLIINTLSTKYEEDY